MKRNKILKTILIVLLTVLLGIMSFVGIFVKDKNKYSNIVKDYTLGMELAGSRKVKLVASSDTKSVNYDAEGNEIKAGDTTTEVDKTEDVPVNSTDVLTKDNFIASKNILEKRLKAMGVFEYEIRLDENTGTMIVNVPENDNTDLTVSQLEYQGKFEIIDSDTKEVLMNNDDIKTVRAGYGTNSSTSATVVFINIEFNKEGTAKFKDITSTYTETQVPVSNDDTSEEIEGTEVDADAVDTESAEEPKTETVTKEITINVDGSALLTTHFESIISTGVLQLSVGSSSSQSTEELQESYIKAINLAALLDGDLMPVVYDDVSSQGEFVDSEITNENIAFYACLFILVALIGMLYMVIRFRNNNGVLAPIYSILYIEILLLVIRYTNIVLTVSGLAAIAVSYALGYIALLNRLKCYENMDNAKEAYKKSIIQTLLIFVPVLIIAIIFTFNSWLPISSFGTVTFWGAILSLIYML